MSNSMLTRDLPSYRRQGGGKRLFFTILGIALALFFFATLLGGLFLRSYRVGSVSMQPTLIAGDRLIATPLLYGKESWFGSGTWLDLAGPERGAVVAVLPPWNLDSNFFQKFFRHTAAFVTFGRWRPSTLSPGTYDWEYRPVLRRVVALPGDQVSVSGGKVTVRTRGASGFRDERALAGRDWKTKLSAVVVDPRLFFADSSSVVTLGPDEYWVMADNRAEGLDSRHWGPVKASSLRGLVLLRYWPPSGFGPVR